MKHKLILFIILAVFFSQALYAQIEDLEWSKEFIIGCGSGANMAIDPNTGYIHIIFTRYNWGPKGLKYVKLEFDDEDLNFLAYEDVPGGGAEQGFWMGGTAIAVDNDGYPHVLYRAHKATFALFDLYYKKMTEAGWGTALNLKNEIYRGFSMDMAIDANDRVHINCAEKIDERVDGFYYRIHNNQISEIHENFEYARWDNGHALAVTPDGKVHMVFGQPWVGDYPVSYYYSNDAGQNFSLRALISQSNDKYVRAGHPDIDVDIYGNAHICYGTSLHADRKIKPTVQYVKYHGDLKTQQKTVVTSGTGFGDLEEGYDKWFVSDIAVSDSGNTIAIVYQTKDKTGDDYNISPSQTRNTGGSLFVKMSTDQGATWTKTTKLADYCHMYDGRTAPRIEAYGDIFFVVYEARDSIRVRAFPNNSDPDPVADAGGPYIANEGDKLTFDASGSYDIGMNRGIVEYAWDTDNDGTFEIFSTSPKPQYTYMDDYNGQAILRVTDHNDQTDYDTTTVTVYNVDPVVSIGNDTTINEGTTMFLRAKVTEPGSDLYQCQWTVKNKTYSGINLNYNFPDNDKLTFIARVEDDDGAVDVDSIHVTVLNVSPIADAGGPYSGGIFVINEFDASNSFDPGVNDNLTYYWDFTQDWKYDITGINPTRVFEKKGVYNIHLKVVDKDGGADSTTTYINITNYAPEIINLSDISVEEGSTFNPINLNQYVNDPDQDETTLIWQVSGIDVMTVTLQNNVLTVTPPHNEWSGKDTLSLVVTDAGQLQDSIQIVFYVIPVNDPPQWVSEIPDTSFAEDDTIYIPLEDLLNHVSDIDNTIDQLAIDLLPHDKISWNMDSSRQSFEIIPYPDWNGTASLVFSVTDPSMATAFDTTQFTVTPVPDPPDTFSLVSPLYFEALAWPDTLNFKWRATKDPDLAGGIFYKWELKYNSQTLYDTTLIKTELSFVARQPLDQGLYRWFVTAYDQQLDYTQSNNIGFIAIGGSGIDDNDPVKPDHFALKPNYPNPFNPETKIEYHLAEEADILLTVYNQMGQIIRVLENSRKNAGIYTVTFDGKDHSGHQLPSGIFIYKLDAGEHTFIRKMLLLQ